LLVGVPIEVRLPTGGVSDPGAAVPGSRGATAHFLPIKTRHNVEQLAEIYVKEIVRLHGIPQSIVSDRDPKFMARLWRKLQEYLGTKLLFSTAAHPQTDGQSERVIQTLEDMLRTSVLNFPGNWDRHLPLVEFAYNNSYQASI